MSEEQDVNVIHPRISDIDTNPKNNTRGEISPFDVKDLAESIEKDGLLQPVLIAEYPVPLQQKTGKKYILYAGFRRSMAYFVLNQKDPERWNHIPAILTHYRPHEEALILNITENLQRRDLNIIQETNAIRSLRKYSRDDVARMLGVSPSWVQVRFMIMELPEELYPAIQEGFFSQENVRALHTILNRQGKEACMAASKTLKEQKQRGIKRPTLKAKKNEKKHRTKGAILARMFHIQDQLGNSIVTRTLAWCAGEIDDGEYDEDLKVWAVDSGRNYEGEKFQILDLD